MLAVLSIGVALYVVNGRVTREAERALQRETAATGTLVDQLRTTRTQTLTAMAQLVADSPTIKAAVDTNDPPTVQNVADGYQRQLNSNLLLVTHKSGRVLAIVGASLPTAEIVASQPEVRGALEGHESVSLLPQSSGVLQLVTVPIAIGLTRPEILGTLSIGFLHRRRGRGAVEGDDRQRRRVRHGWARPGRHAAAGESRRAGRPAPPEQRSPSRPASAAWTTSSCNSA